MIDVADGVAPPLSVDVIRALDALGDRHAGVILSIPPELLERAAQVDQTGMGILGALDPTALSSPLAVASVRVGDAEMALKARQFFEMEDDAIVSKDYAEGTAAMLGAMVNSQGIQEIVSGMSITQNGVEVTYDLTISEAQMQELLDLFTGLMTLQPGESGT